MCKIMNSKFLLGALLASFGALSVKATVECPPGAKQNAPINTITVDRVIDNGNGTFTILEPATTVHDCDTLLVVTDAENFNPNIFGQTITSASVGVQINGGTESTLN